MDRSKELSLAVVGADYPNGDKSKSNRRFEIALCAPGDPVFLIAEPTNRADPNAIAVFSERHVQLGYLTAERAPLVLRMMREVLPQAIFQAATAWGAIIRASFNGTAPTIPPVRARDHGPDAAADPESGFYPDYIPLDD